MFVEGDPHRFDRDQSKAKPGGGEKEGANPASLRGILAVVGGGCIQRAEELGQPSPSCENLFLKVHMIGGSHDQVGRFWLCFDCCNIGAGHVARAASSPGGHDHSSPSRVRPGYAIAMMRLAAAAVIFLCSIAAVSAQEPTGAPSDQSAQRTCVFAGENYSEGAEFCVASHAGLKCESGKWSRDTQLECGGEVGEQHTMPYHGTDEHMMTDHMDHTMPHQ